VAYPRCTKHDQDVYRRNGRCQRCCQLNKSRYQRECIAARRQLREVRSLIAS
jgi:hypothetical protein